jgi:hypothetical protein
VFFCYCYGAQASDYWLPSELLGENRAFHICTDCVTLADLGNVPNLSFYWKSFI